MQNIPQAKENKKGAQDTQDKNKSIHNNKEDNEVQQESKVVGNIGVGLEQQDNNNSEPVEINQFEYINQHQYQQYQQYQPNYQNYPNYAYQGYHPQQYHHWNSQPFRGNYGHRGHWRGGHHYGHHGQHYNNHGYYQNQMPNYQYPNMLPNYAPNFQHPKDLPYPQQYPPFQPHHPHHFAQRPLEDSENAKIKQKEQCNRSRKQGQRGKHWRKKCSRSKSADSSSSSSSEEEPRKRRCEFKKEGNQNSQISFFYKKQMNDFLQSRQIKELQRQKIVRVLSNRFPEKDAPIEKIIQYLQFMEKENLVFRMPYVKLIKIMIRFQFDLSEAIPKIQKIQNQKIKKFEADQQFNENYGDKQQTPLLDVNDLILNDKNVIYLVDGNNILPTNKHFRRYFQSKHIIQKVVAQIKCQWYFSHAFNAQEVILFFDQKYEEKDYKYAKESTVYKEQQVKRFNEIKVIYGDGTKADNKIVEKLQQLCAKEQKLQIILISADRDLIMRCQEIKPILHTSGKFFFKYTKYKINRKYKGNKDMKHLTKSIIRYSQFY